MSGFIVRIWEQSSYDGTCTNLPNENMSSSFKKASVENCIAPDNVRTSVQHESEFPLQDAMEPKHFELEDSSSFDILKLSENSPDVSEQRLLKAEEFSKMNVQAEEIVNSQNVPGRGMLESQSPMSLNMPEEENLVPPNVHQFESLKAQNVSAKEKVHSENAEEVSQDICEERIVQEEGIAKLQGLPEEIVESPNVSHVTNETLLVLQNVAEEKLRTSETVTEVEVVEPQVLKEGMLVSKEKLTENTLLKSQDVAKVEPHNIPKQDMTELTNNLDTTLPVLQSALEEEKLLKSLTDDNLDLKNVSMKEIREPENTYHILPKVAEEVMLNTLNEEEMSEICPEENVKSPSIGKEEISKSQNIPKSKCLSSACVGVKRDIFQSITKSNSVMSERVLNEIFESETLNFVQTQSEMSSQDVKNNQSVNTGTSKNKNSSERRRKKSKTSLKEHSICVDGTVVAKRKKSKSSLKEHSTCVDGAVVAKRKKSKSSLKEHRTCVDGTVVVRPSTFHFKSIAEIICTGMVGKTNKVGLSSKKSKSPDIYIDKTSSNEERSQDTHNTISR